MLILIIYYNNKHIYSENDLNENQKYQVTTLEKLSLLLQYDFLIMISKSENFENLHFNCHSIFKRF